MYKWHAGVARICLGAFVLSQLTFCGGKSSDSKEYSLPCEIAAVNDLRVINGVECVQSELSVVRVILFDEENNPTYCSGLALAPRKVLTAAHCFGEFTFSGEVQFRGRAITIDRFSIDPSFSFNEEVYSNDFALIELAEDLPVGVIVAEPAVDPKVGEPLYIFGFGASVVGETDLQNSPLKGGEMMISSIDSEYIRAEFDGSGQNTCVGDSGGPAFVVRDGRPVLVAVVSSGTKEDCSSGDISVFSRTDSAAAQAFLNALSR